MIKISPEKLEELKQNLDLVDLISSYVPLKQSGKTFTACCPFHQEKTPSFHVNPTKQFFKCFGCGTSGDAIHFVRYMEKLEFVEAVVFLADRYNVFLEEGPADLPKGPGKQDYVKVLQWAAKWFQRQLFSPKGQKALAYLEKRQISEESIGAFLLGFAPEGWTALLEDAKRENISFELLEQVGLIKKSSKGQWIDLFTNRVMFPIHNTRNEIIGFGGRTLDPEAKNFKYLNSPETPIFKKNQNLYGLHLAKENCKEDRRLILVEGYTDVIFCHQEGIATAVAPLYLLGLRKFFFCSPSFFQRYPTPRGFGLF